MAGMALGVFAVLGICVLAPGIAEWGLYHKILRAQRIRALQHRLRK